MKNLTKSTIILSFLSFLTFFTSGNADIKVVASIKPIHSLASYLMDGVAKPDLIVDGYASPHGFALKPSHAKMLQNADLIFWVGEDLENFLEKPLKSIAKKAEKIELMEIKGLKKLEFRERNIFEGHDDHGHDEHKEHGHTEDKHDDGALVPYMDLCIMSLCDHAIIANSSMSWWGAWLQSNPNKKVIAPKMWFGSAYQFHDTKDLYCDGWTVL